MSPSWHLFLFVLQESNSTCTSSLKTPIAFKIPHEKKPSNSAVTPVCTHISSILWKAQLQRRTCPGEELCHLPSPLCLSHTGKKSVLAPGQRDYSPNLCWYLSFIEAPASLPEYGSKLLA